METCMTGMTFAVESWMFLLLRLRHDLLGSLTTVLNG